MRIQSGRWTVVLAVAVVVPSFFLAGCKSGTNLVSLPKMPNLVTWGKDKPSDTDVAKNQASQLPAPPSAAAFAGQNGANSPYGTPRYPNTGRSPVQPSGVPYSPGAYPQAMPAGGGLARAPAGSPDPYSPAYAQPTANQGGFYRDVPPNYERTASRNDQYGGSTYAAPTPSGSYDNRYDSSLNGERYPNSSAVPSRGTEPAARPYSPNPALSSRAADSYSRPAGFESVGGAQTAPGGPYDSAYDRGTPSGEARPAATRTPYEQPNWENSTPLSSRGGPVCTDDSCTTAGSSGIATASGNPHYRPGNTGDLDRNQWIPTSTANRSQPPPVAGPESSAYGNDALARKTGYELEEPSPRGGMNPPGSSSVDYSRPQSTRDSGFGSGQY